jgi:hypothetical protein
MNTRSVPSIFTFTTGSGTEEEEEVPDRLAKAPKLMYTLLGEKVDRPKKYVSSNTNHNQTPQRGRPRFDR